MVAFHRSGQWYFVSKDHLGSTRVVTDESNQQVSWFSYMPFGNQMGAYTSIGDELAYRFTGLEYDDETGLHNFKARLYDSESGRFLAMDPAGQFPSPYTGIGNNPIMMVDEDGEWVNFVIGAVVGGASTYASARAAGARGWELFGYTAAGTIIGAVSSGAASGVSSSLSASSSAVLSSGVVSSAAGGAVGGAINGAYSSALMGGNFGEGAWQGALGGAAGGGFAINTPGIIPGAAVGAGTGGLSSGLVAEFTGGDFWEAAKYGAISGGIMGGISGYVSAKNAPHDRNVFTGYITREYLDDYLSTYIDAQHPNWNHGNNVDWRARAIFDMGRTTDQGKTVTIKRSIVKRHLLGRDYHQMYLTAGHEAVHVGEYASGNYRRTYNNFRTNHPNASGEALELALRYQLEINAYNWELNEARRLDYKVDHYRELLQHYQGKLNGLF